MMRSTMKWNYGLTIFVQLCGIVFGQFNNNMQSQVQQFEGSGFGMGGMSDMAMQAQGMGGMPMGGMQSQGMPMGGMQAQGMPMGGYLPGSYEQMQSGGMLPMGGMPLGGMPMSPMQAQGGMIPINPMQAQGVLMPGIPMQAQGAIMPIGGFSQMQAVPMSPYAVPMPYIARPYAVGPFGMLYDETENAET